MGDSAFIALLVAVVGFGVINFFKFHQLFSLLEQSKQREIKLMAVIDDVETAVAEQTSVVSGVVVLLGQLHDMVLAAGTDPVKLAAVRDQINANKTALATAVTANTIAASEPPTPPVG